MGIGAILMMSLVELRDNIILYLNILERELRFKETAEQMNRKCIIFLLTWKRKSRSDLMRNTQQCI